MTAIFLENVIPLDHCIMIERAFLKYIKDGNINYDDAIHLRERMLYGNTAAVFAPYKNIPDLRHIFEMHNEVDSIYNKLTLEVKKYFNHDIEFKNSYLRNYYNNSELPIHTDKVDLDITLSVNVGGLENWPIHISNKKCFDTDFIRNENEYKNNTRTFYIPKGCGVVSYGNYPHWRDKLICDKDEYVMQIFYHWKII